MISAHIQKKHIIEYADNTKQVCYVNSIIEQVCRKTGSDYVESEFGYCSVEIYKPDFISFIEELEAEKTKMFSFCDLSNEELASIFKSWLEQSDPTQEYIYIDTF